MIHDSVQTKQYVKLLATPEAWLLAGSIAWCALLGCGLMYFILVTTL